MKVTIDSEQLRLLIRGDEITIALPAIAGRDFSIARSLTLRLLGASSLADEYLALHAGSEQSAYWMARALKEGALSPEVARGLTSCLRGDEIDQLIEQGEPTQRK